MKQISLLGCGWLGLPLAKKMVEYGFSVKGSTTSESKLDLLASLGITPFLLTLNPVESVLDCKSTTGTIADFLVESKTLIIDIPPQLRGKYNITLPEEKTFVNKIKNLIPHIENSSVQNVLFVSSTSVYGEINGTISEETPPNPDTESGKQLLEAEKLLQNNPNFKTTILRFGGLIGEDRNPTPFLAGKTNLSHPESPINFIHLEDCIGIILKIIELNSWSEIYNGVTPFHPTRESYYFQKATELGLPLPQFDHSKTSSNRLIISNKVESDLKYVFIKPNL